MFLNTVIGDNFELFINKRNGLLTSLMLSVGAYFYDTLNWKKNSHTGFMLFLSGKIVLWTE